MKIARVAILTVLAFAGLVQSASALGYGRQYYSSWYYSPKQTYHYRYYYYKPYDDYNGYKHHYCVYYPRQEYGNYCYYYNPYSQKYWGRCGLGGEGKEVLYSHLPEKEQKAKLSEIPQTAFPKPAPFPAIPEATDKVKIDAPPDDLPSEQPPGG